MCNILNMTLVSVLHFRYKVLHTQLCNPITHITLFMIGTEMKIHAKVYVLTVKVKLSERLIAQNVMKKQGM